jgi:phosphorylated CTD-interacting factor 1
MSNLQVLLYKLHMLACALDVSVGDVSYTQDDHNAQTMPDEDTPEVAVARNKAILELKSVLLHLCKHCPNIQREPANALCRFLFSSKLPNVCSTTVSNDPLLPSTVSYDKSICKELRKVGYSETDVKSVCENMYNISRAAVKRLKAIPSVQYLPPNNQNQVLVTRHDTDKWKLIWADHGTCISDMHLKQLQDLYSKHSGDIQGKHFNRRLYCLLIRYETLNAPMYQCSCTKKTFDVMSQQFGVTKECFASPFNKNAEIYWSAFPDTDSFFGSQGDFFTGIRSLQQQGGSFYANPPFVEEVIHVLRKRIEEMLTFDSPVSFIVVLPSWTDDESHAWMVNNCIRYTTLQPNAHTYIEGNQQVNTKKAKIRHVAKFKSSVFILQNKTGQQKWRITDTNFDKLCDSWKSFTS